MSTFKDDPKAEDYDKYGRYYPIGCEHTVHSVNPLDAIIDYESSFGIGTEYNYHRRSQAKTDDQLLRKRNLHAVDRSGFRKK